MNKIFKVIWNSATQTWVVVSELGKAKGKKSKLNKQIPSLKLTMVLSSVGFSLMSIDALAAAAVQIGDGATLGTVTTNNAEASIVIGKNASAENSSSNSGTNNGALNAIVIGNNAAAKSNANIVIGDSANANGSYSIVIGQNATIVAEGGKTANNALVIGKGAKATNQGTISLGLESRANGERSIAIGGQTGSTNKKTVANGTDSIAFGMGASTKSNASNSVALGVNSTVMESGINAMALGVNASSAGSQGLAIGAFANASGMYNSLAIGTSSIANATSASAIGYQAKATGNNSSSFGASSQALGTNSAALGTNATANANSANALGYQAKAMGNNSTSLGTSSQALGENSAALGLNATAKEKGGVAIASNATSTGKEAIAIGVNATATHTTNLTDTEGNYITNKDGVEGPIVDGVEILVPSIAIGSRSNATSANAISIGTNSNATGNRAIGLGSGTNATGNRSVALGWLSRTEGNRSSAVGAGTNVIGNYSSAVGTGSIVNGTSSGAFGAYSNVTGNNTYVLGSNVSVATDGSVILGNSSAASQAVAVNTATINGITYNKFAGNTNIAVGDYVSIGSSGQERQIKNVAPGNISLMSTDAINGSQLYLIAVEAAKNNTVTSADGSVIITTSPHANGSINYDLKVVGSSVAVPSVQAGNHTKVSTTVNSNGSTNYIVNADNTIVTSSDSSVSVTATSKSNTDGSLTYTYDLAVPDAGTGQLNNNPDGKVQSDDSTGKLANVADVAHAINKSGWNTTLSNGNQAQINPGDTLNYVNGNGTKAVVTQDSSSPNIFNVSFDVSNANPTSVNANGSLAVPEDGSSFVNATTLVNSINKVGWNVFEENDQSTNLKDRVTAGDNIVFANGTNTLVNVSNIGNTTTITYSVKAGKLTHNANGTVSSENTDGTVATVEDVATAINSSGWNTTLSNGDQAQINPGDSLNYVNGNGTTAVIKRDPHSLNVFNVSFDVDNAGETRVTGGKIELPNEIDGAKYVNATTLVNAINKAGFTLKHSATDGGENLGGNSELINAGDTVEMIAGKNLSVKQGENGTITYATKENVSFSNAQVNSTFSIGNNTTDNPTVNFNTTAGSPTNVTNNGGESTSPTALNLTDSEGKPVQIKGVESSLTVNQLPTNDGNGTTDSTNLLNLTNADPNSAVTVGDLQNYGWVVSTPDNQFTQAVKNANEVKFTGSDGIKVAGAVDSTGVYNITFEVNAGELKPNANGTISTLTTNGTVATVGDVANAINNSGWNTTLSNGDQAQINPGDTLNYVDGNGTTATVKQDPNNPNVFNVSFDVNNANPTTVNNNGSLATPAGNEGANFVNATTLVDAINKAGFTLKHSAVDGGEDLEGDAELINPGDVIEMIAGKNLSVKQGANGTITYATKDDVVFENTVVNSTLTVGNNANGNPSVNFNTEEGTATNVTSNGTENLTPAALNLTDVNGEPVQLKGIESSLTLQQIPTADKDGSNPSNVNLINLTNANPNAAVTVADLQNYGWVVATPDNQFQQAVRNANHVNFVAGTGVSVEGAVSSDGVYNITIATNVSDITGSVTPNNNGTVTANNSTGNVATVGDVANAINNSGWNTTLSDGSSAQINPGDTLNYVDGNGTTAVVKQDPSNPNVFNVSFDVNNANLTTADDSGKLKTPDAEEGKNFVNATTLVDAVNKAAWNVASKAVDGTNGENEYSVDANSSIHAGDTVNIDAGKNIKITGQGDTIEIHTTDDVVFNTAQVNSTLNVGGADGVTIYGNGTIGINGKDGIPGKDGQPGMNGSNATVTVVEGTPGINGKDGETLTRVVYTDANGTTHEIATLDDGLKFKGDTGEVIAKKLGETLEIIGRTDVNANVTDKNLRVDNEEGKLVLKMAKELQEINSISNNNGTTITLGDANNNNTVNINNATISNVAPGVNGTDAVNVDQLEKVNATANAGWFMTTNHGDKSFNVKPNASVDLRTANNNLVITQEDGNITFGLSNNLNLTSNGSVTIGNTTIDNSGLTIKDGPSITENGVDAGDKKVTNVSNGTISAESKDAINGSQLYAVKQIAEAGWNLSVNEGEDAGNVAPGANVDLRNSDGNIVISKDANNVTFNLAKDIKVDTLKANTSVTVGNDTVHTSIMNNGITVKGENSTVTLTDKGLDNGGNKITNVAAGTNATDAVNVSQLNSTIAGVQWKLTGNNDNANATTVGSQTVSFNDSESVKANVDGVNVSFSVKAGELGNEAGKVTSNSTNGSVATVKNVADAINNSGWNIALTDGSNELVKPGDIVKFVNGSGTTANVAKNANGGVEVSFNVNNAEAPKVNEDGSIKVPSSENGGSHYVNATTLATTVNNAAWNVDSKAAGGTVINVVNEKRVDSQAATKVKAGNTVNINAGNNIEITRSGADITVATSMTPTFNTVQVGGKEGVTLGSSTAKDGVKELSVGARGAEARITNVAPGIADTDAVNVDQLKAGLGNVHNHIGKVDRNLRAGIAGANAAAGLPQVYIPGKSMVAAAAGTFKGQSAVAVGYSRASDNGKVILKLQGNANTRGDFGGSVGVGYQW
ncbi:YadA-like family protein [Bibersteinia trehalosi]|uniref:YadA-like family protein n=1 Tax=Bibersteinia trehalosi TaxID=47735 RepID=UPI002D7736BE|nr:YadA-like family protein [Bibersteinia trehalosi]